MTGTSEVFYGGQWRSGGAPVNNPPDAPALALTPLATQITATVTPGGDGGSPITSWLWTCNPGSFTATTPPGVLTNIFPGLALGAVYTVTAKAVNAVGQSPAATATAQTQTPPTTSYVKPTSANSGCRLARNVLTPITGAALQQATKGSNPQRTWSGYLVTGGFQVYCADFSMTDCIVESGASRTDYWLCQGGGVPRGHLSYVTFDGLGSTSAAPGVCVETGTDWVTDHCEMRGAQDGYHPSSNSTAISNYIHKSVVSPGAHADGVQFMDLGGSPFVNVTFVGNRVDTSDALGGANSAIQFGNFAAGSTIDGWNISDNWIDGGFTSLSGQLALEPARTSPVPMTNCTIKRNKFGLGMNSVYRGGAFIGTAFSDPSNVWELTGTTLGGTAVVAGTPIIP
jgi:hypothetical protein